MHVVDLAQTKARAKAREHDKDPGIINLSLARGPDLTRFHRYGVLPVITRRRILGIRRVVFR